MARTRLDKDYYAILGLHPGATPEQTRAAYRRLALDWHPDRRPGDPGAADRFKEISEAYAVLINPAMRREYDQARQTGAGGPFRHSREDLFRDLFANPGASAIFEELAREFERMGMRVDRHYFRHTLFGGRTVVTGGVFIISPLTLAAPLFRLARAALRGALPAPSGADAAAGPRGVLGGLARLGRRLLALSSGVTSPAEPTARADVTLPLRLTRAEAEGGSERRVTIEGVRGSEELRVTVPPGMRAGRRLRLRGKGRPRPDGSRGDAYLVIEIIEPG